MNRQHERVVVYGFQTDQVVLIIAVWFIGFAAALARVVAFAPAKRRTSGNNELVANRFAFACVAGFFTVGWLGVVGLTTGNDWVLNNRHWIACFASVIGFLGPEQQKAFLITLLEIGMRITKKDDDK